jgi:hypothetical protein
MKPKNSVNKKTWNSTEYIGAKFRATEKAFA